MLPAQGHALAFQHRLQDQGVVVEPQAAAAVVVVEAGGGEPVAPGRARPEGLVQVDQLVARQLGEVARRAGGLEIGRAADREDLLGRDQGRLVGRPFAVAQADAERDSLGPQVDVLVRGLQAQVDLGMGLAQLGQARHHPVAGEGGRGGEGDVAVAALALQGLGRAADVGEADGQVVEETLAVLGQRDAAVAPVK